MVAMVLLRSLHQDIMRYNQAESGVSCDPILLMLQFIRIIIGRHTGRLWVETGACVPATYSHNVAISISWYWSTDMDNDSCVTCVCLPWLLVSS